MGEHRARCAGKPRLYLRAAHRVVLSLALALLTTASYASEGITFYHWDALGSPVAATDEQGNIEWREQYRPYGERIQNQTAAQINTRWYTGHPHDRATGLTYAGARYYDPVVGRFMGVDPVEFNEDEPDTFNRYVYVANNPYRYVDPDGRAKLTPNDFGMLPPASVGGSGSIGSRGDLSVGGGGRALPAPSRSGGLQTAPSSGQTAASSPVRGATAPQIRLTQEGLEHIVERHWATSGARGAGKFSPGTKLADLRNMIRETVKKGTSRANTNNRPGTIFEHDFGRTIGTDLRGNTTGRLRVVIDPHGTVITSFPY